MTRRLTNPFVVSVGLAAALAVLVLVPGLSAQEEAEDAQIVVGVYQPQQVAEATGLQQRMMEQMQGLQQRAQQAQQEGDQAAMQQIQMEAQQMQEDATNEFVERLGGVMQQVAESIGADLITTDVSWSAPGVTTQDVTQAVIDAMSAGDGGEGSGEESDASGSEDGS